MTDIPATIADQLREEIRTISQLVDSTYPDGMAAELVMRRRTGKVFEEAGEMADAVNGFWGENPRKGVTHTIDDGGSCPLCQRPRCTAAAKTRPGERCRKNPHPGASICTNHGLTQAGRAAAADRQAEAKADAAIRELWPGLADTAPIKDPIDLLARTAAAMEQMADSVGARVNALHGKVAGGEHMTQLRAEVVLLDRILDKVIRSSDRLASLGIEEKHVELEQQRAQLVTAAFLAALSAVTLLPADRDLMLRTFLQGLGRGPEVLEQAGGAA